MFRCSRVTFIPLLKDRMPQPQFQKWNRKRNKIYKQINKRLKKNMTRIRLFRRRFLSKSPTLYYCYVRLWICVYVCLVHVPRKKFVCFAVHLLNCLRAQWASSHYRCVKGEGFNVVKFTESCFCLFIYINIFSLPFFAVLYDVSLPDSISLPFEKFRKSWIWPVDLGKNWEKNSRKRNLYQSMILFYLYFQDFSCSPAILHAQNKSKSSWIMRIQPEWYDYLNCQIDDP